MVAYSFSFHNANITKIQKKANKKSKFNYVGLIFSVPVL